MGRGEGLCGLRIPAARAVPKVPVRLTFYVSGSSGDDGCGGFTAADDGDVDSHVYRYELVIRVIVLNYGSRWLLYISLFIVSPRPRCFNSHRTESDIVCRVPTTTRAGAIFSQ